MHTTHDMEPDAVNVQALDASHLLIEFANREQKIFNMAELFDLPVYQKLKDRAVFSKVYIDHGVVHWDAMTDLAPETAYFASVTAEGVGA